MVFEPPDDRTPQRKGGPGRVYWRSSGVGSVVMASGRHRSFSPIFWRRTLEPQLVVDAAIAIEVGVCLDEPFGLVHADPLVAKALRSEHAKAGTRESDVAPFGRRRQCAGDQEFCEGFCWDTGYGVAQVVLRAPRAVTAESFG